MKIHGRKRFDNGVSDRCGRNWEKHNERVRSREGEGGKRRVQRGDGAKENGFLHTHTYTCISFLFEFGLLFTCERWGVG